MKTRDIAKNPDIMEHLHLNPGRQLLGDQCSGTLILAKLGFLQSTPAGTDLLTKPWVQEAGVAVLNQTLYAQGNPVTAGGCLASQYLVAWVIARLEGLEAARAAMHHVAPVGEKEAYVERAMANIVPYSPAVEQEIWTGGVRGCVGVMRGLPRWQSVATVSGQVDPCRPI